MYLCEDVNTAVKILSEKLTFILDTMAPMKTIQVRKKYVPWLSKATLNLMKERDALQKHAAESKNDDEVLKVEESDKQQIKV